MSRYFCYDCNSDCTWDPFTLQ